MSLLPKILSEPLLAGERALILTGNLNDYRMVDGELVYQPSYYLGALHNAGHIVITFAKSMPPKIYRHNDLAPEVKREVEAVLKHLDLFPLPKGAELDEPEKLRAFLSKLRRLLLTAHEKLAFVLHLDYLEHFTGQENFGQQDHIIMSEFLHSLSISPALRKTGRNAVVAYLYDGDAPAKLKDFYLIELPFPDHAQTEAFLQYVASRPDYGELAGDLRTRMASIVRGLPLKSSERMFRHAKALARPLEVSAVVKAKGESIVKTSEGTLHLEEPGELSSFDQVVGMRVVKQVLTLLADLLRQGRPTGRGLCLVGPPGTCKSVMITLLALSAGYNCLKLAQVKDALVGRSEYLIRLAISLIVACAPAILFMDEIDKAVPTQNQGVSDGGVSSDQLAQLQEFLARDDLRHKGVFVVSTSNAPQHLGTALQDRFTFLPVLGVIPGEIPELLRSFVPRLKGKLIDSDEGLLLQAGETLYAQGASPRQMLDVVQHSLNLNGQEIRCRDLIAAAEDFAGQTDPAGVQAAILQSVRMCTFKSWLPWAGDPNYPLPPCLEGIVDVTSNTVDYDKLDEKLAELLPYAQL
jgi:hypothetical protein